MISVKKKTNLLYIHSDQHTPYVMGCSGDPLVQTPHLDSLAASGVIFKNTYCPSPICVPSRMSTLTGCFPYENECWTNAHVLDSGIPTLAHSLGAAGYNPILFGRMHAMGPDQLHGYAERYVGDHSQNYIESNDKSSVDHGELTGTQGPTRLSLTKSGPGQNAYQVHDEDVVDAVIGHLNKLGQLKNEGHEDPFCLSVGLMLPHQPFVARKEDYQLYDGKMTMPRIQEPFSDKLHPYFKEWRQNTCITDVTNEEILRARTAYWALVTRTDILIGKILKTLKENGLDNDTMIVYTSDHGEQVGEHNLWWKQTFYENSVKVPLIISWPGKIPPKQINNNIVSSLDLNATILDALNAPALPRSRGRSMMDLMTGESKWEDLAYSEYCTADGYIHRMIRMGDYKFNYYKGMPGQLFNLKDDPDECCDLFGLAEYADIQKTLQNKILEEWDPEWVETKMTTKSSDYTIFSSWANNTKPQEYYRWNLLPEMDYLDEVPS